MEARLLNETRSVKRPCGTASTQRAEPLVPFQVTSQTRPERGGDPRVRSLARRLAHRQHAMRRLSENPSSSAGFAGAIRPLGEARRGPPRPPSMGNEVWRSKLERY